MFFRLCSFGAGKSPGKCECLLKLMGRRVQGLKLLHTADLHLGKLLENQDRYDEQWSVLEEIAQIAEDQDVDLVLLAGDTFDAFNPPAEAERMFFSFLHRLSSQAKRAVVVIAGNHDQPQRLSAAQPLLVEQGVFVVGLPGDLPQLPNAATDQDSVFLRSAANHCLKLHLPRCTEGITILALPYVSESRLNELFIEDLSDQKQTKKNYQEKIMQILHNATSEFESDNIHIIMTHLSLVGGSRSDSERLLAYDIKNSETDGEEDVVRCSNPIYGNHGNRIHCPGGIRPVQEKEGLKIGGSFGLSPQIFPVADYIALGHFHRPQRIQLQTPCYYSGSPLAYSFSEVGQTKSVIIAELKCGQAPNIQTVPLKNGYPLASWQAESFTQALEWCGDEEKQNVWVDLSIKSLQPLSMDEIAQLHRSHKKLVGVRVILPEMQAQMQDSISHLSIRDKFCLFATQKEGVEPLAELVDLFSELLAKINEQPEEQSEQHAEPGGKKI